MINQEDASPVANTEGIQELLTWLRSEAEKRSLPITFSDTPSYTSALTISIPAATGSVVGDLGAKVDALETLETAWNEKHRLRLLLIPQS